MLLRIETCYQIKTNTSPYYLYSLIIVAVNHFSVKYTVHIYILAHGFVCLFGLIAQLFVCLTALHCYHIYHLKTDKRHHDNDSASVLLL